MKEQVPTIRYEDDEILVVIKPQGMVSQQEGLPTWLQEQRGIPEVYVVHRLDRQTGGVMVYGKTSVAAAALSAQFQANQVQKEYVAIVEGEVPSEGQWEDLLFYDRRQNKAFCVDKERKGAKLAQLSFKREKVFQGAGETRSMVSVHLQTGRTHQIRVQFASRKHPIVGDRRYGGKGDGKQIALWCQLLSFLHPTTKEPMLFQQDPPVDDPFWQ